jgi:hypothetical protein
MQIVTSVKNQFLTPIIYFKMANDSSQWLGTETLIFVLNKYTNYFGE